MRLFELTINSWNVEVEVFKNTPPITLLTKLKNTKEGALRGIFSNGDVYWCDAALSIHHNLSYELGIPYDLNNRLSLHKRKWGVEVDCDPSLFNVPYIKKLIITYANRDLLQIDEYVRWGLIIN